MATELGGREVIWKTGEMGLLADGNCTLRIGRTTVFAAVVCSNERSKQRDGLPLQVTTKVCSCLCPRGNELNVQWINVNFYLLGFYLSTSGSFPYVPLDPLGKK